MRTSTLNLSDLTLSGTENADATGEELDRSALAAVRGGIWTIGSRRAAAEAEMIDSLIDEPQGQYDESYELRRAILRIQADANLANQSAVRQVTLN